MRKFFIIYNIFIMFVSAESFVIELPKSEVKVDESFKYSLALNYKDAHLYGLLKVECRLLYRLDNDVIEIEKSIKSNELALESLYSGKNIYPFWGSIDERIEKRQNKIFKLGISLEKKKNYLDCLLNEADKIYKSDLLKKETYVMATYNYIGLKYSSTGISNRFTECTKFYY